MLVEIDEGSGFCFGVTTAIRKAEEELAKEKRLYCLGDIVHNGKECERLRELGMITVEHEQMRRLRDAKILFRAHGEPPTTYQNAEANNLTVIDATCPVVLSLQRRIKKEYMESQDGNTQIVIYGKNGHAEVIGLVGQTEGNAIVVENLDDLTKLDFSKNISLYSQTTKSLEGFRQLVEAISSKMEMTVMVERNVFRNNQFSINDWLEGRYNMLMSQYARNSQFDDSTSIEKPFWHLETDGFWHLNYQGERLSKGRTPSKAWLKDNVEFAYFDESLWILLQNREWRIKLREYIIEHKLTDGSWNGKIAAEGLGVLAALLLVA